MRQRQRAYAIIEAPSVLGLFPGGVEGLPEALLQAGLADALRARRAGRVPPPPYDHERDPITGLLNPTGLREFSHQLADAIGDVLDGAGIPIVLGGDCSILLGALLALRRRGRYGLLFIDGHADFYQPEAEPNGEAASMDLALATGRGPRVLADLEGRAPLVRDEDVVQLGRRDAREADTAGSQRIEDTDIAVFDLGTVRERGARRAAADTLERLCRPDLDGFWLHLDCDVVDDALMPAVDYRLPGGLTWEELQAVVGAAAHSGDLVGLEVTIFNPALDADGSIAQALVACLAHATTSHGRGNPQALQLRCQGACKTNPSRRGLNSRAFVTACTALARSDRGRRAELRWLRIPSDNPRSAAAAPLGRRLRRGRCPA